jgi:hypothetical protein
MYLREILDLRSGYFQCDVKRQDDICTLKVNFNVLHELCVVLCLNCLLLLTRRLRKLSQVFPVIKMKLSRKFYGRHHEMGTMTKYLYHEYFWRDSCCSVLCFVNDYLSFYLISFRHCIAIVYPIYDFWLPIWFLQTFFFKRHKAHSKTFTTQDNT